jgi:hypothetical protein
LNGVLLGNGTNPIQATSAGSANQVFRVPGGGGAPSFGAIDLSESAAVTGILSFGFGGTGATTTFTAGSVIFAGDGRFKQNNANFFWDDTAQRLGLGTSSPTVRLEVNGTGAMNHFKGRGGAPSVASGTCAGTGGAVSLTGTDAAGTVTLDTGSATPSSSVCFTVTFVTAYATAPHVIFSASNAAAAGLSGAKQVYSSSTASTFTFTVGSTSLSNSTTYKWSYYVVE